MYNDEPTLIDALDRKSLVKEVADAVATCTPPQVFGIHGDWGLGKTSFLHQVQWYLTATCPQQPESEIHNARKRSLQTGDYTNPIRAVWFDAWRYQYETEPVIALLQEMRSQLSWTNRFLNKASRDIQVAVSGALLSMENLTKNIGFRYSKFQEADRKWKQDNLAVTIPSHLVRMHLQDAIAQLLSNQPRKDSKARLVVFIDDVDRCDSEMAYRLIEGLKIYLTLDNCVFLIGMNQKVIEQAIASRLTTKPNDRDAELQAAAYMEKLCQNIWHLPALQDPNQVLVSLLMKTVDSNLIRNSIKRSLPNESCFPPNPRRLKGLANPVGRLSHLYPKNLGPNVSNATTTEATILLIVAYIYQFHHDLYIRWESEPELYSKIVDKSHSDESAEDFLADLVLPWRVRKEDATPTPVKRAESTFPDPRDSNLFWVQLLVLQLDREVTHDQFKRYLHGASR